MKFQMKNFRRFALISTILLLAILPILSACSNNGSEDSSSSPTASTATAIPTATPEATQSPAPSASPEKKDPVTLTVLTWFVGPNQKLFDKFHEKYPWITIEANTKINKGIINNVIAGDKADLVFLDNGLSQWMTGDLLTDLTPYIEKDQRIQSADKIDNLLESFSTGGKQWAAPYSDIPMWILVNKDLMKKYGMTMPNNDWTYDDFLEMAKKATNSAANDWGMVGMGHEFTSIMTMANGTADNFRYMNKDSSQSVANTPAIQEDFKWVQDLTNKWHVQPTAAEEKQLGMAPVAEESFIKGNVLFMLGADWMLETVQKAKFEWDVLPMPKGKKQQATIHQAGSISIPKSSKYKEEAFLYISFLFDVEAQKSNIETGSSVFIKDPALANYFSEVPIWKGKNVDAVKLSANMCCFSSDPRTVNLSELAFKVNGGIDTAIREGKNISTLFPAVEAYNTKAVETRKSLGW
jgi:multiple sugar transport system substrate-binding protein